MQLDPYAITPSQDSSTHSGGRASSRSTRLPPGFLQCNGGAGFLAAASCDICQGFCTPTCTVKGRGLAATAHRLEAGHQGGTPRLRAIPWYASTQGGTPGLRAVPWCRGECVGREVPCLMQFDARGH